MNIKKLVRAAASIAALVFGAQAHAGIPVIDGANLANSVQQVIAWGKQYTQMVQQIQQLQTQITQAQQTFNSLNGIRGMASLVNNPTLRTYLPPEWNDAMNVISAAPGAYSGLSGSVTAIRDASKLLDIASTGLDSTSDAARAYQGAQNQAATNRALGEAGYKAASDRIAAIQTLLDKVNDAPDQKDILDLQARIQAEQAMVQNENVKLAVMAQLQQAQRDIQAQQAREISMKSTKGATGVARF